MPWVKGVVFGEVTQNGRIVAQTRALQVMETPKPPDRDAAIQAGLEVDELRRVYEECPEGPFELTAYFGGATAMLVPWSALALLDERRMRRLYEKYFGPLGPGEDPQWPELVAIMHVRNTGAPGRQNDAEPSGGMAASANLLAEQVSEMVEMGVYNDRGWLRFILPYEIQEHQDAFQEVQDVTWWHAGLHIVRQGFPPCAIGQLELLSVGRDQFNGRAGILTAGPVGDFSFTVVVKLRISEAMGKWKFLDMETHNGTPMRRHMVAIAPRPGRSPVVFQLNAEGALDDFGHHFVLDGENRELAVTHIGRAVLEALGWLP